MQITPNLIHKSMNPHKIEMIKDDGRYIHLIGKEIKGINVKEEINDKLTEIKRPFEEGE